MVHKTGLEGFELMIYCCTKPTFTCNGFLIDNYRLRENEY